MIKLQSLFLSKLGYRAGTALGVRSRRSPAATRHHIVDIFAIGSQPKVSRVHAGAHIAIVKDVKPFRNRAVCKSPCQPVGGVFNIIDAQAAISMIANCAGKNMAPTLINACVIVESLLMRPVLWNGVFHSRQYNNARLSMELERHSR